MQWRSQEREFLRLTLARLSRRLDLKRLSARGSPQANLALSLLRRFVLADSLTPQQHFFNGNMHFYAGRYDQAAKSYSNALRMETSASRKSLIQFNLGLLCYHTGNHQRALRHFQRAKESQRLRARVDKYIREIGLLKNSERASSDFRLAYNRILMAGQGQGKVMQLLKLAEDETCPYQIRLKSLALLTVRLSAIGQKEEAFQTVNRLIDLYDVCPEKVIIVKDKLQKQLRLTRLNRLSFSCAIKPKSAELSLKRILTQRKQMRSNQNDSKKLVSSNKLSSPPSANRTKMKYKVIIQKSGQRAKRNPCQKQSAFNRLQASKQNQQLADFAKISNPAISAQSQLISEPLQESSFKQFASFPNQQVQSFRIQVSPVEQTNFKMDQIIESEGKIERSLPNLHFERPVPAKRLSNHIVSSIRGHISNRESSSSKSKQPCAEELILELPSEKMPLLTTESIPEFQFTSRRLTNLICEGVIRATESEKVDNSDAVKSKSNHSSQKKPFYPEQELQELQEQEAASLSKQSQDFLSQQVKRSVNSAQAESYSQSFSEPIPDKKCIELSLSISDQLRQDRLDQLLIDELDKLGIPLSELELREEDGLLKLHLVGGQLELRVPKKCLEKPEVSRKVLTGKYIQQKESLEKPRVISSGVLSINSNKGYQNMLVPFLIPKSKLPSESRKSVSFNIYKIFSQKQIDRSESKSFTISNNLEQLKPCPPSDQILQRAQVIDYERLQCPQDERKNLHVSLIDFAGAPDQNCMSQDSEVQLEKTVKLGWMMCEAGLFKEGVQKLEKAYQLKPNDQNVTSKLAFAFLVDKQPGTAIQIIQLSRSAKDPFNRFLKVLALSEQGKHVQAINQFNQLCTKFDCEAIKNPFLTFVYKSAGNLEAAYRQTLYATIDTQSSCYCELQRAKLEYLLGFKEIALRRVSLLNQYKKQFSQAVFVHGKWLFDSQQYQKAIRSISCQLNADPQNLRLLILFSEIYFQLGRYRVAKKYAKRALKQELSAWRAWLVLGKIQARVAHSRKEFDRALTYLHEAREYGDQKLQEIDEYIAYCMAKQGEFRAAFQYLQQRKNQRPIAKLISAYCLCEVGAYQQANQIYQEVLNQKEGRTFSTLHNKGVACLFTGKFEQGNLLLQEAEFKQPQDYAVVLNLANSFLLNHNFKRANQLFRRAIALSPQKQLTLIKVHDALRLCNRTEDYLVSQFEELLKEEVKDQFIFELLDRFMSARNEVWCKDLLRRLKAFSNSNYRRLVSKQEERYQY